MLELYHHGSSVSPCKVRLVLEEKELDWTGHYVDVQKGEQFAPEYRKLNPNAVVPTLIHDGRVICESTVINEYLNEAFPEPSLVPDDPYLRSQMRIWTKAVDEGVQLACQTITLASVMRYRLMRMSDEKLEAFLDAAPDPVKREQKRVSVREGYNAPEAQVAMQIYLNYLDKMEAALQDRDWLLGDQYSLADIAITPYVNRLKMIFLYELFIEARPRVAEWFSRIQSRPNFEPAIDNWMPQDLIDDFAHFGQQSAPEAERVFRQLMS